MTRRETDDERPGRGRGRLRGSQLLALSGLTGFAVSQPLLSLAGENPTLFTFADLRGWEVLAVAVTVALVPPLVLWGAMVLLGLVDRRLGDGSFLLLAALLAGATAIQLAKASGVEGAVVLGAVAVAVAAGFVAALRRWSLVDQWLAFTSPLPILALVFFVVASPSGQLLRSPTGAAARIDAGGAPSLVFIMLDELPTHSLLGPDGGIDPVRFPNLATLADEATWYPNYTAMAPSTVHSVPSILTGLVPSDDAPLWTEHPDSLFSLLAPTHELAVWETVTQLCGFEDCAFSGDGAVPPEPLPTRLGEVLGDLVGVWGDRVSLDAAGDPDLGQFREDAVPLVGEADQAGFDDAFGEADEVRARPGRLTEFLESLVPADHPGLHYLHLMLPHQPWMFHPDGTQYVMAADDDTDEPSDPPPDDVVPPGEIDEVDEPDPAVEDPPVTARLDPDWGLALIEQQHLFQAGYADRLVGEVLDRLEETGLYDDAVIVVTADHGITFQRYPDQRSADQESVGSIAHVPLLVKDARQRDARVDETNLMAVDLLPTLAERIGVEVPWSPDGHPAGSPEIARRGSEKVMFSLDGGFRGSIDGTIDFDSTDRPGLRDRLVGPVGPGAPALDGLAARLDVTDLLGEELDDLGPIPSPESSAAVIGLDRLRSPPSSGPVPGAVAGMASVPVEQGVLLVAVNGRVVTVAPLQPAGLFTTLLPPGVLEADNELRLAVVADGEVLEVEVG